MPLVIAPEPRPSEGGDGLDAFLEQYPAVHRDQAQAAMQLMRDALLSA